MALYNNSGMVASGDLQPVAQVLAGKYYTGGGPAAVIGRGKDGGSFFEGMRGGLPIVGVSVAYVAANGLATGAATPVIGFGMFLMLLGGLSLVTIHVLRA